MPGVICKTVTAKLFFVPSSNVLATLSSDFPLSGFPNAISALNIPCDCWILYSFSTSFAGKSRFMTDKAGVVIKVVTNAMITSITKIEGGNIPISYPIFNTISSISPRVFIKIPIERLSFHVSPRMRAVKAPPINFPLTATKIKIPQIIHKCGELSNPISVRSPVNTKNKGNSKVTDTSSILSIINLRK